MEWAASQIIEKHHGAALFRAAPVVVSSDEHPDDQGSRCGCCLRCASLTLRLMARRMRMRVLRFRRSLRSEASPVRTSSGPVVDHYPFRASIENPSYFAKDRRALVNENESHRAADIHKYRGRESVVTRLHERHARLMRSDTLHYMTEMTCTRAEQILNDEPQCLRATMDQARLESAIIVRIGLLARGHTPGSVESAIRWVEPRQRSIVIHTGDGFDLSAFVAAVTPEVEAGTFNNGIPALRSGPSGRGVVLYRDGIDAAVILAGITFRDWREAVEALQAMSDGSSFIGEGQVLVEEARAVEVGAHVASGHGGPLLRSIGALQAIPHTRIHVYGKSPGTVVEVVQPEADYPARDRLKQALEYAGLEFVADRSPMGPEATYVFQLPGEEERPLILRFAVRTRKFPA